MFYYQIGDFGSSVLESVGGTGADSTSQSRRGAMAALAAVLQGRRHLTRALRASGV